MNSRLCAHRLAVGKGIDKSRCITTETVAPLAAAERGEAQVLLPRAKEYSLPQFVSLSPLTLRVAQLTLRAWLPPAQQVSTSLHSVHQKQRPCARQPHQRKVRLSEYTSANGTRNQRKSPTMSHLQVPPPPQPRSLLPLQMSTRSANVEKAVHRWLARRRRDPAAVPHATCSTRSTAESPRVAPPQRAHPANRNSQ